MARILIAEDEARVASLLAKGLRASGHVTETVEDGPGAAAAARDRDFDLLVLDLGLPGFDGMEVLRAIRRRGERLPVLILTARADAPARVAGLEQGADDYMTKPFRFDELHARIRARLRERTRQPGLLLRHGELILDTRTQSVAVHGGHVDLTGRECSLLETFMRHPDRVLTRAHLLSTAWGYDFDPGSNAIDVDVRCLRRKLGAHVIETVRGMGYRLVPWRG
jgi:DNA-binding response OmpR family regulator